MKYDRYLHKTAEAYKKDIEIICQKMKYIDMHCDTLTAAADNGLKLFDCGLQTDLRKLKKSGCAAQCFAIFTRENERDRFFNYLSFFKENLKSNKERVRQILHYADFKTCETENKIGCILTVENLGFSEGDEKILSILKREGVKIASLVWNGENCLAYPNVLLQDGLPLLDKRENRALKHKGREFVERLDELKIIIDVSHLSDGGAEQILNSRKLPVVASHSNAAAVCNVPRNLKDVQIKKLADCGGVIGVNFCAAFLGGETFESVFKHISHIVNVGGEDCIAFGSDFDGIPPAKGLEDCKKMPELLNYLNLQGFNSGFLEKLCYKNFLRVFKDVCG